MHGPLDRGPTDLEPDPLGPASWVMERGTPPCVSVADRLLD